MSSTDFLDISVRIAMLIMTVSLLFPFYRLYKGPTLPDRVVALDQIAAIVIGLIFCDAIAEGDDMLLDVVIIVSFVLVFGSVIIAHYLYKKETT